MKLPLSQAEKFALIAFASAMLLLFVSPFLAAFPLFLFLLSCLVAPFFPRWGFFLPIISRSQTGSKAVALTFDDGPSPDSTPFILELLKKYNFKATFFVIGQKAEHYPDLIADIIAAGHSIGNHSWQHDNLLMLRSRKRLRKDIRKAQEVLGALGVRPLVFRPPVGITNPKLKPVLCKEQLQVVTFNCRAFDHGNRKVSNLAERITSRLKPGGIILLHDLAPAAETEMNIWQKEINSLFSDLQKNTHGVQPLEDLIGFPVMEVSHSKTS